MFYGVSRGKKRVFFEGRSKDKDSYSAGSVSLHIGEDETVEHFDIQQAKDLKIGLEHAIQDAEKNES